MDKVLSQLLPMTKKIDCSFYVMELHFGNKMEEFIETD